MKRIAIVFALALAFVLVQATASNALYAVDYTNQSIYKEAEKGSKAQFIVQALQYDPYPVNPGEWFDVWVKVQNIGDLDAPDARFELMQDYPFSTTDNPVIEYGIVSGVSSAYKQRFTGETQNYANQVILKFRVKTADNAAEGTAFLKISATTDYNGKAQPTTFNLPITIAKTKTDFDVVMQDSTAQGTSFAISNIGSNTATAVTLSIKPDDITVKGAQSYILGNLNAGDFTTVTFQINPKNHPNDVKVEVAYTDTSGIRNVITKTVPVDIFTEAAGAAGAKRTAATSFWSTSNLVPAVIGLAIGILIAFLLKGRKKRHETD